MPRLGQPAVLAAMFKSVAEQLIPAYNWGCKRPSFSSAFYPMFNQDNVALVDLQMPELSGIDVLKVVLAEEPDLVVW